MDIQPLDIVIHIINIIVLYTLLRVLLYKPVSGFMKKRSDAIAGELSMAEQKLNEANQAKNEYDERLAHAQEEADRLLMQGNQKANDSAALIVDTAQQQAAELLEKARDQSTVERREVISSMEKQITDMAISLAGEILKREVNEQDNQAVIHTFFDKAG